MNVFKKALSLLNAKQKRHQIILVFMALIGSCFELVGVSAILPLMQLLMDENSLNENSYLNLIYTRLHLNTRIEFISIILLLIIGIFIVKNVYLLFQTWYISKNSYEIQFGITNDLIDRYLNASYSFFTKHNTSEIQMNLTSNASSFGLIFQYGMQLTTEVIVSTVLAGFMIISNPGLTISVIIMLVVGTGGYALYAHKKLNIIGQRTQISNKKMIQWINQAVGGIKEIIIFDRSQFFIKEVQVLCKVLKRNFTKTLFLIQSPHYISETICIVSVLTSILVQINLGTDINLLVAQLAAFAVAAFRLLPSVGKINGLLGNLEYNKAVVDVLVLAYEELKRDKKEYNKILLNDNILLEKQLIVDKLSFGYDENEKVLNEVNLVIKKGESTALIGPSGAGKSTLADLILGVIYPDCGDILLDGVTSIYSNLKAWQKNIGYIPQTIFLSDDTIRNNIAFGIPYQEIEENKIWKALEQAQLDSYVKLLPDGLDTMVGERGIRLSGGQRQRIGIARALYEDPEILVMDEATSALDGETEKEVMQAINSLCGRKTLIIIAHRLSTIEKCNTIYEVKDKMIINSTYKFHE